MMDTWTSRRNTSLAPKLLMSSASLLAPSPVSRKKENSPVSVSLAGEKFLFRQRL